MFTIFFNKLLLPEVVMLEILLFFLSICLNTLESSGGKWAFVYEFGN